jgi:hypothetical protein
MPIIESALEGTEVLVPINTPELTAGLLGAKLDPVRTAFGIDGRYITEVRLLEIERRILAMEEAITAGTRSAET